MDTPNSSMASVRPTGFHARKALIKHRLVAFKVLLALMDGIHPWLTVHGEGRVSARLGPLARHTRQAATRLREQLAWLQTFGYLQIEELKRGECTVRLRSPRNIDCKGQDGPKDA